MQLSIQTVNEIKSVKKELQRVMNRFSSYGKPLELGNAIGAIDRLLNEHKQGSVRTKDY